jgi:hypothetical protein
VTEASTQFLFEQPERSTVSWQIYRVVDVPTTYPSRINADFADEGNSVEVRQVVEIDTEPLEWQMRAQPGRQVPELTALSALEQRQGDQLVADVNLYKAFGGSWKREDEEWRAPQ